MIRSLFALLFLTACSHKDLAPDFNLIQHWSPEEQMKEPHQPPFIAKYKYRSKELWYIAAKHTSNIKSPTFKTIKESLSKFNPQLVILEGFETEPNEHSPKGYIKYAIKCSKVKFRNCGEPSYSAYLSNQKNIPFIGAEPPDKTIYEHLKTKGYRPQDLVGYYLVRQIPQLKRQNKLNKNNFQKTADKLLNIFLNDIESSQSFEFSEFKAWYKEKSGNHFDINKIKSNDLAPIVSTEATYFNKTSALIGEVREKHILKKISQGLKSYDRVLIVYGAGHHVQQKKVLLKMINQPKYEKPF